MAEDDKFTGQPNTLPAMPEPIQFSHQILEQWIAIPEGEHITAQLTRQDLDQLLFGLLRSTEAQQALENTIVQWSNGKSEDANKALLQFRKLNIDSQNHIRQFFTGLMTSVLRNRSHGG